MKVFVAVCDNPVLLTHFLRHYASQGAARFFAAAHPSAAAEAKRRCRGFPAEVVEGLNVEESVVGGVAAVTAMRLRHQKPGEWAALADLDEFQVHPGGLARSAMLAGREGANVVRGILVDRVAAAGSLPRITARTDLWKTFPGRCRLTRDLQAGMDYKAALVRGHLIPALAHHDFKGQRVASRKVEIHHFKWGSTAPRRLERAMRLIEARGLSWGAEYGRVLDHLRRHRGVEPSEFEGARPGSPSSPS